ncbi:MAG: hypothetical protein A2Y14_00140, partial [Verrucomicrobia bacterium GWF2_51_19]
MRLKNKAFIAGFAMFSMFFGAGNLIFPFATGKCALGQYGFSMMGLLLTGVIVPFLGLYSMILYNGNREKYFETLGRIPAFVLVAIILCLIGPFGAAPRCIGASYGGFHAMFPGLSLFWFSVIFCICVGWALWNRHRVVEIIGSYLTPLLLTTLVVILFVGFLADHPAGATDMSAWSAFTMGLSKGYNTMDLLATFFFSVTIIQYIRSCLPQDATIKEVSILSIIASVMGATMLGLIYVGFVSLGAKYAPQLEGVEEAQYLIIITQQTLGNFAIPLVAITFALACLTTIIVLIGLFADFIHHEISGGRISQKMATIITLLITFLMAQFGFSGISNVLGSILTVAYPALIALAIMNILQKWFKIHHFYVFYIVLA